MPKKSAPYADVIKILGLQDWLHRGTMEVQARKECRKDMEMLWERRLRKWLVALGVPFRYYTQDKHGWLDAFRYLLCDLV